jgi:phosphoribosyl-AMP cyclohydrolase
MLTLLEGAPVGASLPLSEVLAELHFDQLGLVTAIAQQFDTREVLMLAWMNRAAIDERLASGFSCYWSRSRQALWRKGETSGCRQRVVETRFDFDGDAILLLVDRLGGACHTGRQSCFYNAVMDDRVEVISAPIHPLIHQKKK